MKTSAQELLYLQHRHDPSKLYGDIPCYRAHDLWTLSEEFLRTHALALTIDDTTVIYHIDEIRGGGDQFCYSVDLVIKQRRLRPPHWGSNLLQEDEIENIYTIPGETLVHFLPRLTDGDEGHIYTIDKEKDMGRFNTIVPQGTPYSDTDDPAGPATVNVDRSFAGKGIYLAVEHTQSTGFHHSHAWLDQLETMKLVRNVTVAEGVEEDTLDLIPEDPWEGQDGHWIGTVKVKGEEHTITVSDTITEELLLAHINVLSRIAHRLGEKDSKLKELCEKVDGFRKSLKPNAKSFTPTYELPEQSRDFQIERYRRVVGFLDFHNPEVPTA